MELKEGQQVLGRYVVDKYLSRGGMGRVYKAKHESLGFPVALKILVEATDDEMMARFDHEARLMAQIRHPNVVSVLDYGLLEDGAPCLAMEFVDGELLSDRLKSRGPLPWLETIEMALGVLAGLDAVHGTGVLHRDLKPSNIMMAAGKPEIAKLIDFGIARRTAADATRVTQTGMIVGTPAFLAPEQILGYDMDNRTDLYAVGLLLHCVLTGKLPFGSGTLTTAMRRVREPVPRLVAPATNPPLPDSLVDAILNALAVDPDLRPPNAGVMAGWLARVRDECRDGGPPQAISATPARPGAIDLSVPVGIVASPDSADPYTGGVAAPPAAADPNIGAAPAAAGPSPTSFSIAVEIPDPADVVPAAPEPVPAPAHTSTVVQGEVRYVIAAKLPPSRLSLRQERQWLAKLVQRNGRGFVVGAQFWIAIQRADNPGQAYECAGQISNALRERYGADTDVRWDAVDLDFTLSPASLTGAAPLPPVIQGLIEAMSA